MVLLLHAWRSLICCIIAPAVRPVHMRLHRSRRSIISYAASAPAAAQQQMAAELQQKEQLLRSMFESGRPMPKVRLQQACCGV